MSGSIDDTLKQRGNVHGDFSDNADITDKLMGVLDGSPNFKIMSGVQRVALFQIMHKVGRIVSGDPNFADHWHDIGGYARCAEDRLPARPAPTAGPEASSGL